MGVAVDAAPAGAAAGRCRDTFDRLGPGGSGLLVAAEGPDWRPVRHGRWRRRRFAGEIAGTIDRLAIDDRQDGLQVPDVVGRNLEVIAVQDGQIGELSDLDVSLLFL